MSKIETGKKAPQFTLEGTGVDFVKDANGNVTAMVQHWTEGDRRFARKK